MKFFEKSSNKAIGIAMAAIMVASIFAILAPASVADPSVPSGKVAIYYLNPDNSSVPDGLFLKTHGLTNECFRC
ncbi:hypothetical protein C5S39_14655 [Candidatus Methanophagaceae archaeon]|nr:hypothetical protein C5S39_14655 [Methanophagales archaeon]